MVRCFLSGLCFICSLLGETCQVEATMDCLNTTQERLETKKPADARPSTEIDWIGICKYVNLFKVELVGYYDYDM